MDDALHEVLLREPGYFSRFSIGVPSLDQPEALEKYRGPETSRKYSFEEIRQSLNEGMVHLARQGVRFSPVSNGIDPVGELLWDSVMDAFAADRRELRLAPHPQAPPAFPDLLREQYDHRTANGRRYFIRRRDGREILLISATGIPLALWSRFMGDPLHDFKIVAVEGRWGDLLAGGMESPGELSQEADDIINVLETESITEAGVIGWCNGGRLAIEVAARCPHRIRSVVLVSPALGGLQGIPPAPSRFEGAMKKVFSVLAERPALARTYVKTLEDKPPDWESLVDGSSRAAALFGLPPRSQALALRMPMSQADFLLNYGRRLTSDAAYPIDQAFSRLCQETLLVTGNYDNSVNNEFISAALAKWLPNGIHISVKGGGHYVHDLQYQYFRLITEDFLSKRVPPTATARLEVKMQGAMGASH